MGNIVDIVNMYGVMMLFYFMDDWIIFYWGWWIFWASFVGMFIVRIFRGRIVG